jgi:predicted negative regulator of RcsB-dependent stress response
MRSMMTRRVQSLVLLLFLSRAGSAEESAKSVRLELNLKPATELVYDFSSVLDQDMTDVAGEVHYGMTLSGTTRQTVAELDRNTGIALIGWLGTGRWEVTAGTTDADRQAARDQTWIAAYRMDRSGRSLRRESKEGDSRQYLMQRALSPIGEPAQLCAAFPKEDVTVGSKWQGDVLLALPGPRQPGEAVSTITEIREENGTNCCVVRSEVVSRKEESHSTWQTDVGTPGTEVTGTTEGIFDIERGVWLEMKWDLSAKFEGKVGGRGFSGTMNLKSMAKLESVQTLPTEKARESKARIKALDAALEKMYCNEFDEGMGILQAEEKKSGDSDWAKGVTLTLGLVRPLLEPPVEMVSVDDGVAPEPDVLKLYKRAGEHAKAGELQKAVESYREFLAAATGDVPAATRLLAQYRMAGLLEKLGQRDKAMDAYRAMDMIDADDDYSVSLKKKALEKR